MDRAEEDRSRSITLTIVEAVVASAGFPVALGGVGGKGIGGGRGCDGRKWMMILAAVGIYSDCRRAEHATGGSVPLPPPSAVPRQGGWGGPRPPPARRRETGADSRRQGARIRQLAHGSDAWFYLFIYLV